MILLYYTVSENWKFVLVDVAMRRARLVRENDSDSIHSIMIGGTSYQDNGGHGSDVLVTIAEELFLADADEGEETIPNTGVAVAMSAAAAAAHPTLPAVPQVVIPSADAAAAIPPVLLQKQQQHDLANIATAPTVMAFRTPQQQQQQQDAVVVVGTADEAAATVAPTSPATMAPPSTAVTKDVPGDATDAAAATLKTAQAPGENNDDDEVVVAVAEQQSEPAIIDCPRAADILMPYEGYKLWSKYLSTCVFMYFSVAYIEHEKKHSIDHSINQSIVALLQINMRGAPKPHTLFVIFLFSYSRSYFFPFYDDG
jgi:hypothetical protein